MTKNGHFRKFDLARIIANYIADHCNIQLNAPVVNRYGYTTNTFAELLKRLINDGTDRFMIESIVKAMGLESTITDMQNDHMAKRNIERELAGKSVLTTPKWAIKS